MQQILFTFTFNPDTKELIYTSNIKPPEIALSTALRIIQDAVISQARQQGVDQRATKKAKKEQ